MKEFVKDILDAFFDRQKVVSEGGYRSLVSEPIIQNDSALLTVNRNTLLSKRSYWCADLACERGRRTSLLVKHEAARRIRPRERYRPVGALCLRDSVLQGPLIKRVGWKFTQAGVHAVLHLQQCRHRVCFRERERESCCLTWTKTKCGFWVHFREKQGEIPPFCNTRSTYSAKKTVAK
jgi:hypothetical protein